MSNSKTGNLYRNTGFRNGGRRAGAGTLYDDYGDESGFKGWGYRYGSVRVKLPHDGVEPEDLNGPVITVREAAK